jgi:hypothetical protein
MGRERWSGVHVFGRFHVFVFRGAPFTYRAKGSAFAVQANNRGAPFPGGNLSTDL